MVSRSVAPCCVPSIVRRPRAHVVIASAATVHRRCGGHMVALRHGRRRGHSGDESAGEPERPSRQSVCCRTEDVALTCAMQQAGMTTGMGDIVALDRRDDGFAGTARSDGDGWHSLARAAVSPTSRRSPIATECICLKSCRGKPLVVFRAGKRDVESGCLGTAPAAARAPIPIAATGAAEVLPNPSARAVPDGP